MVSSTSAKMVSTTTIVSTSAAANSTDAVTVNSVSAVATTALASLPSSQTSIISMTTSQSELYDHAKDKPQSEIETLIELGKSGGTTKFSKNRIETIIRGKIVSLRTSATNPRDLPSVRSDLCDLSKISSVHYSELKEEILNLLTHLLETDPVLPQTAEGILKIVIKLNSELTSSNAQELTILFQKKFARAFSAAVELYLRHYNKSGHVNAVTEDQKKALLSNESSFGDLNSQENEAIEFFNQMALEASKRLTSDNKLFSEVLQRLLHVISAVGKAYDKDVSAFFSEIKQAFEGLNDKIKEKWFETLFFLRNMVKSLPNDMERVIAIEAALCSEKVKDHDWKFIYGALEILDDIVSHTEDVRVFEVALFGKVIGPTNVDEKKQNKHLKSKPSAKGIQTGKKKSEVIPGVVKFLDCKIFIRKATIRTKNDEKADKAIDTKAKEIIQTLIPRIIESGNTNFVLNHCYEAQAKTTISNNTRSVILQIFNANLSAMAAKLKADASSQKNKSKTTSTNFSDTSPKPSAAADEVSFSQKENFHKAVQDGNHGVVGELLRKHNTLANENIYPPKSANAKFYRTTPLMLAAEKGDVKMCEILLKAGADSLKIDSNFNNALHNAVREGKEEIVKLLLTIKDLINSKDARDSTSLMIAAEQGHLQVCEILLKAGADPLTVDNFNKNTLHHAVESGKVEVVKLLSSNKQLFNAKCHFEGTPLHLAAWKNQQEICIVLLQAGTDPFEKDLTSERNIFHIAASKALLEVVKFLSSNKQLIDVVDRYGFSPLITAVYEGHHEICEILLRAGANPFLKVEDNRYKGINALHIAARSGKIEVVRVLATKELIDSRTDEGYTPHMIAAFEGHREVCEVLLKAGANPLVTANKGRTALHVAVDDNNIEAVKILSTNKQFFNIFAPYIFPQDYHSQVTPLMLTAHYGHKELCEILLKTDVDPFVKNNDGLNALHFAAKAGKGDVVMILSTNKNLIDTRTKDRTTPYLFAVQSGTQEVSQILLKKGANPLAKDKHGRNALYLAVFNNSIDLLRSLSLNKVLLNARSKVRGKTPLLTVIDLSSNHAIFVSEAFEVLLKAGADPLMTDELNWTSLHYAADNGHIKVIRQLSAHKQLINAKADIFPFKKYTAFMLAAEKGHREACEILLEAGSDPLAEDGENGGGKNALHLAAENNRVEVVKLLSTNNKLINSKTKEEKTPLMFAAKAGHQEVCEMLLKAGADSLAQDSDKKNAIQIAEEEEETDIVAMLSAKAPIAKSSLSTEITSKK